MERRLMASTAVRIGSLGALAVLIAVGMAIAPTQYARAASTLTCLEDGTGVDITDTAPIGIGTAITSTSSTGNPAAATSVTTLTEGTATVVTTATGVGPKDTVCFTTTNARVWN